MSTWSATSAPARSTPSASGSSTRRPGRRIFEEIKAYFRNIAVWLAPPARIRCMNTRLCWHLVWHDRVMEAVLSTAEIRLVEVPPHIISIIGKHARDVLGRFAGRCQSVRLILDLVLEPAWPELARQIDPWLPEPRRRVSDGIEWFDAMPLLEMSFGAALVALREAVPQPEERLVAELDTEKLEAILAEGGRSGAERALKSALSATKPSARSSAATSTGGLGSPSEGSRGPARAPAPRRRWRRPGRTDCLRPAGSRPRRRGVSPRRRRAAIIAGARPARPWRFQRRMHVTLLGTGCPQVHARRFGPASLVRHRERRFLIDCGSGVTQRLVGAGTTGAALDALLLTHLHSDHLVDLYQLIVSSWHQGRERPQRIYGPRGAKAFAAATMAAWQSERALRIEWERRPSTAALELEVAEFEEGLLCEADGLRISAFLVDHRPVEPAFGFLLETADCRVAFSGDTTVCDNLVRAAQGVDLLVHECFIHREMLARRGGRSDQGLANVAAYHTLSSEVGKVADAARAPACCCSTTSSRSTSIAPRCSPRSAPTSRARS